MASIADALKQYPRETLTRTPTPLDFLKNTSRNLDLRFYLKRDDLTDLALGGDKPRKLEYEIAHAREQGADTLVTCGSSQSNHARLTTAAARSLGMECAVVLSKDEFQAFQGNLLTVSLMGAQIEVIETDDHWALEPQALALCEKLKSEGKNPHYIPVSGTTPHSCLGYVRATLELVEQLKDLNLEPDAIYTPFGTGGIFSAMLLTLRECGIDSPLIGISVNRKQPECLENLEHWWSSLCKLLDRDSTRARGEYEIHDQYIGTEYGDPTEGCLDALTIMAVNEGILLDPVYSGKTFAGFLDHFQSGRWTGIRRILMLHSGGVPALFAYHKEIQAHLKKRGLLPF